MNNDRATGSTRTPAAVDVLAAQTGDASSNQDLTSDPIGAEVGPLPPTDAVTGDPSNENLAIDGLPGRYERQDEEDTAAGLEMTQAPVGASNG